LGIFVLIIFAAKVSGSHFNPAITLAFILRKDTGRFSRPLGVAYIVFQCIGGFLASLVALLFRATQTTFEVSDKSTFPAMLGEVLGAFFVAFLYLTQTENKTKISNDPAITTLIIAASYLASMLFACGSNKYMSPLNPAVSLGMMLQQVYHGTGAGIKSFYVFLPFPLVGGLCAVFFYEFIYKRVQEAIQESEGGNEAGYDEEPNDGVNA
jgi:glycerol uptake facilitator-like aquaporin